MAKTDNMEIEVLDDGTIKITTDPISAANHMNADEMLKFIAKLGGGETKRERRTDKAHHHHHHEHDHHHEH